VVVPETVAVTRCPVVGAVANPKIVFVVVAPLPQIVCALADPLASCSVPAVELSVPRITPAVRLNVQEPEVVIGLVPLTVI
jgi:hypothetical protein